MEKLAHRFRVHVRQQDVDLFKNAISGPGEPAFKVPLTFPATWYAMPEVQSLIRTKIQSVSGSGQFALLHLEQSIEMHADLDIGAAYDLCVHIGNPGADGKVRVSAEVRNTQERLLVSMSSLFLVSIVGQAPQ
ncbi:hypothetical protein [Hoeflea sp.]|uniref:hypothetical protein n=1 Tax=Hoeflea sp. TaxID=1940281 RepID=UPI003BB024D4